MNFRNSVVSIGLILSFLCLSGCKDSSTTSTPQNSPPEIDSISCNLTILNLGKQTTLICEASDPDGDSLRYNWSCMVGSFSSVQTSPVALWTAPTAYLNPHDTLICVVSVIVSDGIDWVDGNMGLTVYNGDLWWDTGEPFIDTPDSSGLYNGVRDPGEIYFDLPSGFWSPFLPHGPPTRNGIYDGPNDAFDEYELFCQPADTTAGDDRDLPVLYWGGLEQLIQDAAAEPWWLELSPLPYDQPGYLAFMPDTSTWSDRNFDGVFQIHTHQ